MKARNHVLVFPCGTEIGLELHRALRYSPHFRLFGATSAPDHGDFVYRDHASGLPMIGDGDFLPAFLALLASLEIDFIFPAHDEVLTRLAGWAEDGLVPAKLMTPDASVCRLCRSKGATYDFLAGQVPVPKRFLPEEVTDADFPLFVKPDAGQGSRGAFLARDRAALAERLRHSPGDLVLEYLPGDEHTVDCFTDRHGKLRYAAARRRRRIQNGISVNSVEIADDGQLRKMAETINREIRLRGGWFFQTRAAAGGEQTLLEVAPRIAGTSGLARARGVNLPLLSLYDRLDLDVEILENRIGPVEVDRALESRYRLSLDYDKVYIDLDDTLILQDGVNLEAVTFLYQCLNRGVKLILVTRHILHPEDTLAKYRLSGLFDEVVWISDVDTGKSSAISGKAIFIDDSFAEREEVSGTLGIPVFDPSAIEALLE